MTARVIGKPRRRVDARAKVTGQTRFADDIVLPRMLHARLLRSPLPHANIRAIDVEQAKAYPGVHLVLTGRDLPIEYGILPVSQDETALCVDRVRFVGDPVAAVIARDEVTAAAALELIEVDYEPLPTVATPHEALATPAPRLHEYGEEGNIHKRVALAFGDVDEGLAAADHVFQDTFFYQGNGVRQGRWKYLRAKHDVPGYARDRKREEVVELYDLDADIGEAINLAAKYPEKVAELKALTQRIREGRE